MAEDVIQFEPEPIATVSFEPLETPLDFQPARAPSLDQNRSVLRQAPENRGVGTFISKVRESLSPLLGPTEDQKLRDAMVDPVSGEPIYKPLGSQIEQKGLFPALSKPFISIPRAKPAAGDSTATSIAKGALNTGVGFAEFIESPLGVATAGTGAAAKGLAAVGEAALAKVLPRAVAGAFAADIASKTPEAARAAGEASVTGNTQEKTEAYLGLAANVLLPAALGKSAAAPKVEVAKIAEAGAPLTAKVLETTLKEGEQNAIQKQSNDGGVLRQEGSQVGLPKVDEGNAQEVAFRPEVQEAPVAEAPTGEVRKFSERLEASPDIQPEIKESETYTNPETGEQYKASANRFYDPISNQETNAKVNARIEERGIDATINDILTDSPELNKLEKVAGSLNIIKRLNEEASQLEPTNKALADLKRDKAIQLIEKVTEEGTQLGQAVQAFRMWSALGPEGILREYSRNVEKIASNQKKKGFLEKDLAKADPEFQRQILKEGQEIQAKPEGFQRDFATMKLMGKVHRELMKDKSWRDNAGDIAMSWWYASILSSPVTQAVNAIGGINNVLAKSAAQMVANPKAVPDIIGSLYLGMTKGFPEFAAIMKEGDVTRRPNAILKTQPTLEMLAESGNPALRLLSNAKYVSRLMTAVDMVNFKAAEEMKAHLIAREIADKEGLSGNALSTRVSDILYNTKEARAKAETQARTEGLKGYNFKRRVNELIEQQRPEDLRDESAQYGLEATYNNKPQGVAGVIADAINAASNRWKPLKLVVPFVNIPANVFNESLNYTPWGYKRYFYGHFTDGSWFDRANKMEGNAAKEQLAKATAGTLAMATLGTLLAQNKDDKNPKFDITANGPRDPQERYQLMETGWRPYSFKRDGVWYSYLNTPLMVPFAVMGSVGDSMKYGKMEEKDMLTRFSYALWQSGESVMNQSFLSGLRDVLSGAKMSPEYYSKFASRMATSFVVPNAVKWVDRVFKPEVMNANTLKEYFIREIPVARSKMLKPMINVLGETVKKEGPARFGSERFVSMEKSDPIWRLIVDNDAYVSVPSKNTKLGDRTMNPEEYYEYMKLSGQGIRAELEKELPRLKTLTKEKIQEKVEIITQVMRDGAKAFIRKNGVGNGSLTANPNAGRETPEVILFSPEEKK